MIAVIRFPGSNCDEDTCYALELLGGDARVLWHRETSLAGVDAVVLPGGFSYGDYLRSGAMAAQSPVMQAVRDFAAAGGPVLGICNGFQVLTEAGLLPGALALNARPHFICRQAHVRVERDDLPFTGGYRRGQVLTLPLAHAEGSYYADAATIAALEARRGVVFRYCLPDGSVTAELPPAGAARDEAETQAVHGPATGDSLDGDAALVRPASGGNPNGSVAAIAGIVNERGNVLGMMPHPERAVEALLGGVDGRPLLGALLQRLEVAAAS